MLGIQKGACYEAKENDISGPGSCNRYGYVRASMPAKDKNFFAAFHDNDRR
jgi:hypothetical protein